MAKKLKVNKDICLGCGACAGSYPTVFVLDAEGKAEVVADIDDADLQAAIDSCPAGAISE